MRGIGMAGLLCVASICAQAQDGDGEIARRLTPAQIAEVGLSPRQIELLDRYLGDTGATSVEADGAPGSAADPSLRDPAARPGPGDGPIRARLTADVAGWEPGTVFVLDNGQHWRVLKGSMRLRKPLPAPEVKLVPGIAGRWFLQVDEDLPKARVYRID